MSDHSVPPRKAAALPDELAFDAGAAFYPMVVTFVSALSALHVFTDPANRCGIRQDETGAIVGRVHHGLKLYLGMYHKQLLVAAGGSIYHDAAEILTSMLINTAYEAVKNRNDQAPLFEFFRHARNAASHQNIFTFHGSEPRRPAEWRGERVDHLRRGADNPLAGRRCFGEFLGPADALLLLWDVEQYMRSGAVPPAA